MGKKKNDEKDKDIEEFYRRFTYAQAAALAVILKAAAVPTEKWKEMATLFAESFQKALVEALREDKKDGNGHKKES